MKEQPPFSRRKFLKSIAAAPAIAAGGVGVLAVVDAAPANATGSTYRLVKTAVANSAPLRPNYPLLGCMIEGVNLVKYYGTNTAWASSSAAGFPASYANNGDRGGYLTGPNKWWKSANQGGTNDWIAAGAPASTGTGININRVVVYSVQNNSTNPVTNPSDTLIADIYQAKDFVVETSPDAVVWTVRATVRNNNKAKYTVTFPTVWARNVRVRFDLAPGYGGFNRVVELEAYANDKIVLPYSYSSLADANAGAVKQQALEARLCRTLTSTMVQRNPVYGWTVVADNDPVLVAQKTFTMKPGSDPVWGPATLETDITPEPVTPDSTLGSLLTLIGIGGAGFVTGATVALIGDIVGGGAIGATGTALLADLLAAVGVGVSMAGGILVAVGLLTALGVVAYQELRPMEPMPDFRDIIPPSTYQEIPPSASVNNGFDFEMWNGCAGGANLLYAICSV